VYSTLQGSLPLADAPAFEAAGGSWSALQFQIEVLEAGRVVLQLNDGQGVSWTSGDAVEDVEQDRIEIDFPTGIHPVTVFVNRSERSTSSLDIELRRADSTARAQIVHALEVD
jgi:hypothetical protein